MNWQNLLLFTFATCVVFPALPVQAAPSISHHELRINLQPEKGRLTGIDTLSIRADGATRVTLRLAPQCRIEQVHLADRPIAYEWKEGRLNVALPPDMRRGEIELTIRYSGLFLDPVPENPAHNEDPTYGVAATISGRGTFLASGSGWYPEIAGSQSTFRLRLEAPAGTEAVTSGRRVERGTKNERSFSVWETRTPLPGLTLVAGAYLVRESVIGGIPVYTYFYPETDKLADTYLDAAKNYLELYTGLFGPYPFEKFAIAENFFPTGYGFPSWTLLGSSVVRLPFIVETSLGHEIAHSWWGIGVRPDYRYGNWSEGLTTYVADHLYKERVDAVEGREYRLKILRDYASLVAPGQDFPLHRFESRRSAADQAVGYGKAAMVFHMARRRVGDHAFWSALRTLAIERMGQVVSWQEFADRLGQASGQDLEPFFRQWVDRPGAPVLRLSNIQADRISDRWRVQGNLVQEGTIYDLSVPLRLETASGHVETMVTAQGRETGFNFQTAERPRSLRIDPEVDLFRRLDPAEIPPTVNSVRGSTALTVVTADGLSPQMLAASRVLLTALRQDGATIRREAETSAADLRGRDVLFLGLPRADSLLPPLPDGLQLTDERIVLQGESFSDPGTALFVALPRPGDPGRSSALFLAFSTEAAELAARKIPHYGKFSYLVFTNGRNLAKGTWPPVSSPVVFDFPQD